MPIHFLDSSALQHRYLDNAHSRRIRRLVSDRRCPCFVAELSVVEISSAIARRCRQKNLTIRHFDSMSTAFLRDLADGRILVRNMSKRDMRRARDLIRYAGIVRRRNISSADAIIAVSCLDLALERKERLVFYTSDRGLYEILNTINAYKSALSLKFLEIQPEAMAPICHVSCHDTTGTERMVAVRARTINEAAAEGLTTFFRNGWLDPLNATPPTINISVKQAGLAHIMELADIRRWLGQPDASPSETLLKVGLRAILPATN